nr:unnamed protein product [Spirometra erinaceieuropaei]
MARPQDTALARFYGLSKVHKEGDPLRPTMLLKDTPTYGRENWPFQRLKVLTAELDITVPSSAKFLEELKGSGLLPNEVMVSSDIALFSNSILQDLTIKTTELFSQSEYDEVESRLGHAQVLQLPKLRLKTYFTFDGTIYEQVKSTPKCSLISGIIAEALLQRLESLVFQHHRPKLWVRYVDDTFVFIDRDRLLTFNKRLNAIFSEHINKYAQ